MIKKDDIYGSGGELGPAKTATDFRMAAGIESNFVALASDVNAYHNMSDKDLWAVCQELVNLLALYNITPANTYNAEDQKQLATLFSNNLESSFSLTGIDTLAWTGAVPTQNGNSITFPEFDVVFNTAVLYGNTESQHQRATVAAKTESATTAWEDGAHFLYAQITPGSNVATIEHQMTPVLAQDGATKCMLGSVFVINGAFQANTWKFQPWLQITSPEHREMPTAMTKGGFVTPLAGTQVAVGTLEVLDEGINWAENRNSPNIMEVQGSTSTATAWKFVYPNYSASDSSSTDIVTTKICNLDSGTLVDIPAEQIEQPSGAFVIMVPCITPAGQFLLVPPMGLPDSDGKYSQVYNSQAEAANAIYSQQYSVDNPDGNSVIERAIFLGYSMVVKAGATDFTDPEQFLAIGVVPQQLAGFASAGGQSGGGSGAYVPMRVVNWTSTATSVPLVNNAINVIEGNTSTILPVTVPNTNPSTVNQLEIHYTHTADKKGLAFPDTLKWWGSQPSWVAGQVYNIIIEYVAGAWRAGYLTMAN